MYQRLILMRELLSERGSIYIHCDWHKSYYIRAILNEVFGGDNFRNEIVWSYFGFKRSTSRKFPQKHDIIFSYVKGQDYTWNVQYRPHSDDYIKRFKKDKNGRLYRDDINPTDGGARIIYLDEVEGDIIDSIWDDIPPVNPVAIERQNYPTQKPEGIIQRIISSSSNPGDLVFDCFMGSGTTQAVAMKLGRRFIGADINLGAIQTTTKRLLGVSKELSQELDNDKYTGFEVYNVNNYDFFRNPIEAKEILLDALEIEKASSTSLYDGEKDGRMVKIMPVDRICCRADFEGFLHSLPYKTFQKHLEENPNKPAEKITIVCMGHEPDLQAALDKELKQYHMDSEITDILRDKKDIELKRDSEADITISKGKLIIKKFYPMNLMQKLSLDKRTVAADWRELVESVMVDFNYDGVVLQPSITDIPDKKELVKGEYTVLKDAGVIRVKITDLLSESLEMEVNNG
jgi:DNA modification methylase